MLVTAVIRSDDIVTALFWGIAESMPAIGIPNAPGMCIAPAFGKRNNGEPLNCELQGKHSARTQYMQFHHRRIPVIN